jgi:hypothetical protein
MSDAVDIEGDPQLRELRCSKTKLLSLFIGLICTSIWFLRPQVCYHIIIRHSILKLLLRRAEVLRLHENIQGDTSCFACSSSATVKLPFLLADLLSSRGFRPGTETAIMAVVISSILRTSAHKSNQSHNEVVPGRVSQLTNQVLLPSARLQRDEADHADQRGSETEHECEVNGRLVLFALDVREEEEGECVDCCSK